MKIPFKLAANHVEKLQRVKFFRKEISFDCVVIEGYRTKTSHGKLSLAINLQLAAG